MLGFSSYLHFLIASDTRENALGVCPHIILSLFAERYQLDQMNQIYIYVTGPIKIQENLKYSWKR